MKLCETQLCCERQVLPKAFVSEDVGGWRGNSMVSCPSWRQQDCFDEQATLLPFLIALKAAGLLYFHDIAGEQLNFNDAHSANELIEIDPHSGQQLKRWVVDSWVNDQGELPVVLPLDERMKKDWH